MNDDREAHRTSRFLVIEGGPIGRANVVAFDRSRSRMRPLFAGWVGRDGNVVPLAPRPVTLARRHEPEDEWI
jgi:hypothetical protein